MTGHRAFHFVTPSGVVDVAIDPVADPLEVFTLDGSTFVPTPVSYAADGGFSFTVPSTPYYLKRGSTFVVTRALSLDLSSNRTGRPQAAVVWDGGSNPPAFTLTATGLSPFAPGDGFLLASDSVELLPDVLQAAAPIPPGATTLTNASFDSSIFGALEAAQGDTAVISQGRTQLLTVEDGGVPADSAGWLVTSATTGPIDAAFDGNTSVTLAMTALQQKTLSLDWRASQWNAMATAVHPQAQYDSGSVTIVAVPGGTLSRGWVGYLSELLSVALNQTTDSVYPLQYGNPKASWAEVGSSLASYVVPVKLTGATTGGYFVYAGALDPPATMFGAPLAPGIRPPSQLRLDGQNAQAAALTLAGATPVVSWNSTATAATFFRVRVREVYASSGATRTRPVANLMVSPGAGTQIRIPPGVLASGKTYVLAVSQEIAGGPFSPSEAPSLDSSSSQSAETASTQFVVP